VLWASFQSSGGLVRYGGEKRSLECPLGASVGPSVRGVTLLQVTDQQADEKQQANQCQSACSKEDGRGPRLTRSRGATTADQYWTTCIRAGALSAAETSTLVGSGKLHHTVTAHFRPSCLVAHWTTWTPFTTVCAANPRLLQARGDGKILCHVRPGMEPHKSSPAALRHTKQDHCRAISPIPSRAHMS
jgi:hypothetical protein